MKKAMGHLIAALILSILCVGGLVCVIIGVTGVLPSILTLYFLKFFLSSTEVL